MAGKMPATLVLLWTAHLVLTPFYVFDSGLPQPADGVLLLLAIVTFLGLGVDVGPMRPHVARLFAAVWYVAVVGIFHAMLQQNLGLLTFPAFYLYNTCAFCTCIILFQRYRERFLFATFRGIAVSVGLQVLLIPLAPSSDSIRTTLFFNNPNQLGYYAVLCACILTLPSRLSRRSRSIQVASLAACSALALLSLSKAGLAGIAMLLTLTFLRRRVTVLVVGAVLGFGYAVVDTEDLPANAYNRITVRQNDDSLRSRGYDRIIRHPEYLLLGAGEGVTDRFDTEFQGEIHSSFGTMLFCYGAVGSALLAWFILGVINRSPVQTLVPLLPIVVYGATHNGLRSTLMWECIALLVCLSSARIHERGERKPAHRQARVPAAA